MASLLRKFIGLDMYGYPIGVNYKGESAFKTKLGAVLTMLTYAAVLTYSLVKFNRLVHRDRPEITRTEEIIRLGDATNRFNFEEYNFWFTFGFS